MRATAVSIALAAGLTLAAGCVLFTGSTEGYSLLDAGAGDGACMSAASCSSGNVCCLIVNASSTSAEGTCQAGCTVSYPQLCATSTECADAGACIKQSCTVDAGGTGVSVTLHACGLIPTCKATP